MPSRPSARMITKRSQSSRSPSISGRSLRRKLFLSFMMSFTFMLMITGWRAATAPSTSEHIVEVVVAGRSDAGALVDFAGIEQIQNGKALDIQHLVHAFDAQAPFAVEEVGNVGLLEAGISGQAQAGQFAFLDALPERFAQIFLQGPELHGAV